MLRTMRHLVAGLLVTGTLALACATVAPSPGSPRVAGQVTLGTFDSRAVLFAWVGSSVGRDTMAGLHQELESAQAAEDETRVAELEGIGRELQEKIHRQGFSTESVSDLLELIQDALPALARRAGVDVIVSKWDLVYEGPSVSTVDVTDLLVAEFAPSERTLESIREITRQTPVPANELQHDH
jgi:hypothetical protein